jgi:hypothetical protein
MVIPRNYASETLLPFPTEKLHALREFRENKRAAGVAIQPPDENFQIAGQQPSIFLV